MNARALSAALLGLVAFSSPAWSEPADAGRRGWVELGTNARIDKPEEFGRYVDRAGTWRDRKVEPVPTAQASSPSQGFSAAEPLVPFRPAFHNGPATAASHRPTVAPPAPRMLDALDARSTQAAARAARGWTPTATTAPAETSNFHRVGTGASIAQYAGLALMLVGLTGPLRRRSEESEDEPAA